MSDVPVIQLNDGVEIPQLGFGTFQIHQDVAKDVTLAAIEVGYRHLDTAQMYGNERGVGAAVRASGIDRSEFFVTSKLNNSFHDHDDALEAFRRTLADLDVGYVDLFLIHWPLPEVGDYVETWKAMIQIAQSDECRSIGVSNFQRNHLERLFRETDVVPSINQIEVHPYFSQNDLRSFCDDHGIVVEAWSPIAQGRVLSDEALMAVGQECGKSSAQVALRWHIQRGDIVFPKSANPGRMAQNLDIFDFELSSDQMARVESLDRGQRIGPDPDDFNWVP